MKIQIFKRHKSLLGLSLGILILALVPVITHSPYYLDLLVTTLLYSVLGMSFVIMLRVGLINMGIAAFWGIGAYTAMVMTRNLNFSFWAALPLSGLITALIALVIGYILISSESTGLGFVMFTSVIGMLFPVTVGNINYVGGYAGLNDIPGIDPISIPFLGEITFNDTVPLYYLAVLLVSVIILILGGFYSSWIGRAWKAIGLAPRLAESKGVNLLGYKLLAFVISSAIVGFIGCFYVHYGRYIVPNTYSMWINIYIQAYAVLGGLSYSITGPLVGSAVWTFLPQMLGMTNEYKSIFTGFLLILMIMFMPEGLLGLIHYRKAFNRMKQNVSRIGKKLSPPTKY